MSMDIYFKNTLPWRGDRTSYRLKREKSFAEKIIQCYFYIIKKEKKYR